MLNLCDFEVVCMNRCDTGSIFRYCWSCLHESGKNLMYTFLFLVCFKKVKGMHVINSFSCSDDYVLIDKEFGTSIGNKFLIRIIVHFNILPLYSTVVLKESISSNLEFQGQN